jgi:hypothetical protein
VDPRTGLVVVVVVVVVVIVVVVVGQLNSVLVYLLANSTAQRLVTK